MYIEKFDKHSNAWFNCDNWRYNEDYDEEDPDSEEKLSVSPIYTNRNYHLFSILAGVRDYSENCNKISEPKGLPEDISKITKKEADRWKGDGHSHSYLTLKEIKDFQNKNNEECLNKIIDSIEDRMRDEFWIFSSKEDTSEYHDKIRIVFWFDN